MRYSDHNWGDGMRIGHGDLSGTQAAGTGQTQETQKNERTGPSSHHGSGSGGDRVELSGAAGQLGRILATHNTDRAARVQALAAQYQSGSYQPDSNATSRGIISEALGGK